MPGSYQRDIESTPRSLNPVPNTPGLHVATLIPNGSSSVFSPSAMAYSACFEAQYAAT
ncbi:TPA: hypothetical protein ACGZ99_000057 [Elizabethkingia anophelis]